MLRLKSLKWFGASWKVSQKNSHWKTKEPVRVQPSLKKIIRLRVAFSNCKPSLRARVKRTENSSKSSQKTTSSSISLASLKLIGRSWSISTSQSLSAKSVKSFSKKSKPNSTKINIKSTRSGLNFRPWSTISWRLRTSRLTSGKSRMCRIRLTWLHRCVLSFSRLFNVVISRKK